VVTGPDGNLWVNLPGANQIARVVISTQTVTRFTIPTSGSFPNYIIANSGKLYFEENLVNKIGISTVAGAISEVVLPTPSSYPGFLTTGPDGHVWFVDEGANTVGTIKTDGTVVELPIPTTSSGLVGITSGPSRTIWFTESTADKVGEFTVP
jgi:virginiamycin B lyase